MLVIVDMSGWGEPVDMTLDFFCYSRSTNDRPCRVVYWFDGVCRMCEVTVRWTERCSEVVIRHAIQKLQEHSRFDPRDAESLFPLKVRCAAGDPGSGESLLPHVAMVAVSDPCWQAQHPTCKQTRKVRKVFRTDLTCQKQDPLSDVHLAPAAVPIISESYLKQLEHCTHLNLSTRMRSKLTKRKISVLDGGCQAHGSNKLRELLPSLELVFPVAVPRPRGISPPLL